MHYELSLHFPLQATYLCEWTTSPLTHSNAVAAVGTGLTLRVLANSKLISRSLVSVTQTTSGSKLAWGEI